MTNFQSFAGGTIWMAVAAILMLVTFEPVSVQPGAAPQASAEASAAASGADA